MCVCVYIYVYVDIYVCMCEIYTSILIEKKEKGFNLSMAYTTKFEER